MQKGSVCGNHSKGKCPPHPGPGLGNAGRRQLLCAKPSGSSSNPPTSLPLGKAQRDQAPGGVGCGQRTGGDERDLSYPQTDGLLGMVGRDRPLSCAPKAPAWSWLLPGQSLTSRFQVAEGTPPCPPVPVCGRCCVEPSAPVVPVRDLGAVVSASTILHLPDGVWRVKSGCFVSTYCIPAPG